jgi:quercetin dioxygenase-like cupin family protein
MSTGHSRRMAWAAVGFAIAVSAAAFAQAPGFKRTEVQRSDLSVPGREVVQAIAEFAPGAQAGKHTHPGEEVGYVLSGPVIVEIDGSAPKTLKTGDAFFVPAGKAHNARNTGSGSARILATYIVEKGKPTATPVP